MWGDQAVGKLVAGDTPLRPTIAVFVDEEAGADVAQKVQRRLQHFIDRKIAALFEPLLNLQRDETLTGLARGFAFQLVEGLGILQRSDVADDVKALDQEARGALRKFGIRFGQFTIFMPLLLKPAPTRLRLVLWGLHQKLDIFPESPPPGLVTVPVDRNAPAGYDRMSGYRNAGERAIRVDMLERLADLLRAENSRAGFEAAPDMLSITGMTLEQFADLMQGLGYNAEKGERAKVSAKPADASDISVPVVAAEEGQEDSPTEADVAAVAEPTTASETADVVKADDAVETDAAPEIEVFYTFTWGRRPAARPQNAGRKQRSGDRGGDRDGGKPARGKGKPKGKPGRNDRNDKAKSFQARPEKKDKIDPDNPFAAALMGLKGKD